MPPQASPSQDVRRTTQGILEKAKGDTSLQEKHKAEGADPIAITIAKSAGFAINTEDLKTHRQNLSDNEREKIAGGLSAHFPHCG